jgi:hypothetical protein
MFVTLWLAWDLLGLPPDATTLRRAAIVLLATTVVASLSPTVTIAQIADSRAAGPLCQLTLTLVILADLVLIAGAGRASACGSAASSRSWTISRGWV